ncbi:protein INCREASED PETAL GROWTH ANISOTROPY 1 [Typha angustifolia]|uniref:protein INCREASED PETAL GROWTH ANISOTROPY 1 n=1 Tax=Typha angustifolia TaxID=59011 RepID=UPI003C2C5891
MVAGRVKAAMGFQKSPATPKSETPRRSSSSPGSLKSATPAQAPTSNGKTAGSAFARSFGVYFPRASVQVQPRPPDVTELLRLVEELREKESRLRTELLEQKLLKETVAIVPFLEREIAAKGEEIERSRERIADLEAENAALREELEGLRSREARVEAMEAEIEDLRSAISSTSRRFQGLLDASSRSDLVKNVRTRSSKSPDIAPNVELPKQGSTNQKEEIEESQQSRCTTPRIPKPPPLPSSSSSSCSSNSSCSSSSSSSETTAISKTTPPTLTSLPPIPPPLPARAISSGSSGSRLGAPPPPPPPPPPAARGPRSSSSTTGPSVRRVPEVVEFYHSLMRRDSKRETGNGVGDAPAASSARDMIGEIENRSSHLLAIKTDVETQGDFIRFLIKEVEGATFTNIEDVVTFVKWLDDELSCLVDERAVLKHFEWPEKKADALREAAFGYSDLKKLESQASSFRDDPRQPCSSALKKMQALLEKLEHGVFDLARVREGATRRYKSFRIPWEWMSENGIIGQIKLASVKLAMKYMKRVSSEIEALADGPEEEELMLQGVRFAFRVHQFAGGFDVETMRAFQELKDKASSFHSQTQHQSQHQQQKLICTTT